MKSKLIFIMIALGLTTIYACTTAPLFFNASGQEDARPVVRFDQRGRRGDPNILAKRIGEKFGVRLDQGDLRGEGATLRLAFLGFKSEVKPDKQSAGREGLASALEYGIPTGAADVGRPIGRNGGTLGQAAEVGIRTAGQVAGRNAGREVRESKIKTGRVELQYQLCIGERCTTGEATLFARVQAEVTSGTNWGTFYMLAASNDKATMTPLAAPLALGEGEVNSLEALVQEGLVELLLNDTPGQPVLAGRTTLRQLGQLNAGRQPTARRAADPAPTPTPTPSDRPRQVTAGFPEKPAEQLCRGGRWLLFLEEKAWVCTQVVQVYVPGDMAAPGVVPTAIPMPKPTPTPLVPAVPAAPTTAAAPPAPTGFVEIFYDSTKPKMQGENVKKVLAYMANKNYLSWNPAWDFAWGLNADRGWREVEAAASAAGIPGIVKDGRVNASEWQWLSGLPPETFALGPEMQKTEARLKARPPKK